MKVGVHHAKTHLSRLLRQVGDGVEIEIVNRGRTVALLVPPPRHEPRELGVDLGVVVIAEDFDAPLPEDVLEGFEPS